MTSMFRAGPFLLLMVVTASGCAPTAVDPVAPGGLVATVDDIGLSVEGAAELLAPFEGFANNTESARSLVELWVDYTVLAEAMATDSLLADVDLSEVQRLQENELKVLALRDMVIEVDTIFSDEELRDSFEEDDPATQLRARHILIVPPEGAGPAQRDSVRAMADSLRQAIADGADFVEAARLYSADFTANEGGDLGVFGRGEMVPAFETAAFALAEGELSEVIQTNFGFHIIRVDERFGPPFEQIRAQYRAELASRARAQAEGEYIGGVAEDADLTVVDGAPELAQRIVGDPWTPLAGAEAARPLAEWTDGQFTAGEFRSFMILQPRDNILQLRAAGDFAGLIRTFALQKLLLGEAEARGIDPGASQWQLSEPVYRQQAGANARTLALFPVEPSTVEARQEAVRRALVFNLSGEIGLLALGPAMGPLRLRHSIEVEPEQLEAVVARVAEIRESEGFQPFRRQPSGPEPSIQGQDAEPQPPVNEDPAPPAL